MSGTRLTRKVTVEGSKKLPEGSSQSSSSSSGTRRSVFDRLGPGTSERSRSRESYPPEKCRNWLRDGRCQFGRNCKFLHGPFSEPKSRTKSVRSIVRTDVDRSEGDDGAITVRTQSLDSLEPDDDDEKEISVLKKKKHRPLEESSEPSKKSEKLKRRQQIDQDSSQGEGDDGDDHRKRKKKVRKRQLSGGVVITKPESPEEEERDWGDEDYEEERSDLEWEERGELDYERQLNLEKRRQDLQRQLALMDEEDAKREKAERKVKDVKKERDEDLKPAIPVVHSKLHPEKSSVSPADEFSPVSSQSTPKKKKKKADGEGKKVKAKRKISPSTKELKKRKGVKPAAGGSNGGIVEERPQKVTDVSPEKPKASVRTQPEFEETATEKPRVPKKKQVKPKKKESQVTRSSGDTYLSPTGSSGQIPPRTLPPEEIPREKRSPTPEEQRVPVEKLRRRTALSSPEGSNSPAPPYGSESRTRRSTDPSDGSLRKTVREVHNNEPPGEAEHKVKAKGHEKPYREERSPGTPEHGRRVVAIKDTRHVEEGRSERRKKVVEEEPPRSPSPEDIPARDPITPPGEQRRHRTPPPRGDRRGPQTPPGEPDYDDVPKQGSSDRGAPRHRGPYTPPTPSNPPVRSRDERNREEFHDGRSESLPYREEVTVPRSKERPERDTRYSRQRGDDGVDDMSRGSRGHASVDEDYPRARLRDEEPGRLRHRNERQDDYHQRNRPKDDRSDDIYRARDREPDRSDDHYRSRAEEPRGGEPPRRKPEVDEEYLRRREDRDEDHLRSRNRELERDEERSRRRDDRSDDHQRGRVRDEHEDDMQRPRGGRDFPRRPFEGGDERHWEGRGERDNREVQFGDRDRRRPDMPRQDISDNRSRERAGERPRDREGRYPPPGPGPDYHRRSPPIPHGSRRSPPPHGPPRGPHRFEERRRSLSPGGRREEGYRQGPPRDQGGYGMGRESAHGRGGHSAPFENRGRPVESRRRISPPPRQYAERGRGAPRGRGIRGGRGFPDRSRPPGDRYQDPPRDRAAPWDPERRRERDHPRDRNRPHDESRDRDRRPRGELSPGRGPRHWEDRRAGSPGRVVSPSRDRRTHEQEKIPREAEEERRRRSDEEEDEEWEYEEDLGDEKDKIPRQGERKRPRETGSSISTIESPAGGKKRRSETPEMEVTPGGEVPEGVVKQDDYEKDVIAAAPVKQTAKPKKKKVGKKGKGPKPDGEPDVETQKPPEPPAESEESPEGEKPFKVEKKLKKEKGKTKEKVTKKKKKNIGVVASEPGLGPEKTEEPTSVTEESGVASSENLGEVTQQSEEELIPKVAKKRRHPVAPDGEETKMKGGDKPPKKKKKKKNQPEVVVQPWADLEDEDEEMVQYKSEGNERQGSVKDSQFGQVGNIDENKSSDTVADGRKETGDAPKDEESVTVFSDWSDDSPIGDDAWSDVNEPEISESKPKIDDRERAATMSPVRNEAPTFDDVYDPISDDELDAMLGDDDEDARAGVSDSKGPSSAPMAVEDVDWSALVSAQNTSDKTGEEPGAHLKRFTPGHVFSRIGISSSLAGPRLTKLVQKAYAEVVKDKPSVTETVDTSDVDDGGDSRVINSIGALVAGAAAKRRERGTLFTDVGPCRRALCARMDLAMRKRLRRLTGKVGLFQVPSSAPVDNELYSMSVALYKHEHSAMDSSVTKLVPSRVGAVLATVNS